MTLVYVTQEVFFLKRHTNKEVLELIRNTRETIQFLRSQLHEYKGSSKNSIEQKELRRYEIPTDIHPFNLRVMSVILTATGSFQQVCYIIL